jgi:uncharacterized cupredoxin-like copper-binding protein
MYPEPLNRLESLSDRSVEIYDAAFYDQSPCPKRGTRDHQLGEGPAVAKRRLITLTVLGLMIVLSGCGGGAATEIDATLKDFAFAPNSWEIAAGETITINLDNEGAVEHEWVLLRPGVTISDESELPATEEELLADFVYWEDELEPGESKSLTFTAPEIGEYQIICAIESHFDAGMKGTLTVVDGG